jgi:Zn-dependent metalloprotease
MRGKRLATGLLMVLCGLLTVIPAEAQTGADEALGDILRTLQAATATEGPIIHRDENTGFARFLCAPPDGAFVVAPAGKALDLEKAAHDFLMENRAAFGNFSAAVSLKAIQNLQHGGDTYVRFNQYYGGLNVFGAQAVVQFNKEKQVVCVVNGLLHDTAELDRAAVSLVPDIASEIAGSEAVSHVAEEYGINRLNRLDISGDATLVIYEERVGSGAKTRLAWLILVEGESELQPIRDEVLIDAHNGGLLLLNSLIRNAKNRIITDAANSLDASRYSIARTEGEDPAGIEDVDNAYKYLGDCYDYYFRNFGWDSLDNQGVAIEATVRLPINNAFMDTRGMTSSFGTGYTTDDIVAHEYTHGLMNQIVELIYMGESGAVEEGYADAFGEFIDLTNGTGNDSPEYRWFMGEDLAAFNSNDPIRYLRHPPLLGNPDRVSSPHFVDPDNIFLDRGGVHINAGVINKLTYLLTDGDYFNGRSVAGMGIDKVAQLFFKARFLLPRAAFLTDFAAALNGAAIALGYSQEDLANINEALRAVEISFYYDDYGVMEFRAVPISRGASPAVQLKWWTYQEWTNRLRLYRSTGNYSIDPDESVVILDIDDSEGDLPDSFVDDTVKSGVSYYYTLRADMRSNAVLFKYDIATAGGALPDLLTEAFSGDEGVADSRVNDLAFTQLLFSPAGPPPEGSLQTAFQGGTADSYQLTVTHNVTGLPVARQDENGAAIMLDLGPSQIEPFTAAQEGYLLFEQRDFFFPFFGRRYTNFYLSANGYIAFEPVHRNNRANYASLESHFVIPRIAFLFGNLAPEISGQIWVRQLSDRLVATFDRIPEFVQGVAYGQPLPNTAQIELFFSGHIRMTFQELNIKNAIIGLSDGRGLVTSPANAFSLTDFSAGPVAHQQVTLAPVAPVELLEDGAGGFRIKADPATPDTLLTAEWTAAGPVPFSDMGDGTGLFYWDPEPEDRGLQIVRVIARTGDDIAYQDVQVLVGRPYDLPAAANLQLSTGTAEEDPAADRTVGTEQTLYAEYDYYHPEMFTDQFFAEAESLLTWHVNNQLVPGLTNSPMVPSTATSAGQEWYFRVVPIAIGGVAGDPVTSPVVTIVADPEIEMIHPNSGPEAGGNRITITGTRLDSVLSVAFGGVESPSIEAVSSTKIIATAPLHAAGVVDVTARTSAGSGIMYDGYTYGNPALQKREDVNGDGKVDAVDVQLVTNAVLELINPKALLNADTNSDGLVDASDIQIVVNGALRR